MEDDEENRNLSRVGSIILNWMNLVEDSKRLCTLNPILVNELMLRKVAGDVKGKKRNRVCK